MTSLGTVYETLKKLKTISKSDGMLTVAAMPLPALQLLLIQMNRDNRQQVVIIAGGKREYASLRNFFKLNNLPHATLPFVAPWGRGQATNQNTATHERLTAIAKLTERRLPLLTTMPALAQYTISTAELAQYSLRISQDHEVDLDMFTAKLQQLGYQFYDRAYQKGEFTVRGGVVDVFAVNNDYPFRIEFFADQVVSLREFAPETMRSRAGMLSKLTILPACEAVLAEHEQKANVQHLYDCLRQQHLTAAKTNQLIEDFRANYRLTDLTMFQPLFRKRKETFASHLPATSLYVFPDSKQQALDYLPQTLANLQSRYEEDIANALPTLPLAEHFDVEFATHFTNTHPANIEFVHPTSHDPAIQTNDLYVPVATIASQIKFIRTLLNAKFTVIILCSYKRQLTRVANIMLQESLPYQRDDKYLPYTDDNKHCDSVVLAIGTLEQSLLLEETKTCLIPDHVLLQTKQAKPKEAIKVSSELLSSFSDLQKGDLVVHQSHGIGKYRDIVELELGGAVGEFMLITFAHEDKIYLPVDKFNILQKYISCKDDDFKPRLDSLRQQSFASKKSKATEKAKEVAKKLLNNYAQRQLLQARKISPPTEDYFALEASFPFEETNDQLQAIEAVNTDLSLSIPMDRLICGDVGFGKTEVALRASMRVIADGGQALLLVPTTILGLQHFQTFEQRLATHGFKTALVNRLVSAAEVRQTVAAFNAGKIDLLIGTHKLLALKLRSKDIALIILDEEQKFGVEHKESIKALKPEAHLLTLSATPIPRTLHMSLLGLKDISMINEPPQDRQAVRTYVADYSDALAQSAIEFELARQGQVYFVHNRISDIHLVKANLQRLVPQAKVVVAHGKLLKTELERAMIAFLRGEYNVLLCTTIIESGIDMPNVNTLVVDEAERFGLSQLYQLRGRVGRSHRQAHAYFLTSPHRTGTEDSHRRLQVLATHYELGSGFKIAHKDLEIRGAGNLIGSEQSGVLATVGLEMFTALVDKEIKRLREQRDDAVDIDPEIKIPVSAVIPKTYLDNENQRLKLYKRIFSCDDLTELDDLIAETDDLYGRIPDPMQVLLAVAKCKIYLRTLPAESVRYFREGFFRIKLHPSSVLRQRPANTKQYILQGESLIVHARTSLTNDPQLSLNELNTVLADIVARQ
ncbi:MAG: transcription-repair coupling factor [Pseudomonadota bacterium]|nr:transcription-repair coupling factor [Pseudomonadota bacterium]